MQREPSTVSLEFLKGQRLWSKPLVVVLRLRMSAAIPLLLRDSLKWLKGDFMKNFCSIEERRIAA
jgi:hypothetical protein